MIKAASGRWAYSIEWDNNFLVLRQPEKTDEPIITDAEARITPKTIARYTPIGTGKPRKAKRISGEPLWSKGRYGVLNQILLLNGELVGFAKMDFQDSSLKSLTPWRLPPSQYIAQNYIALLDQYQGKGIGSRYGPLSTYTAKELGAQWLIGCTYVEGGMYGIRMREGWEAVDWIKTSSGMQAYVRKRLNNND